MKTIFTLNFVNKSIVGTKSAIARANKCLEPEYSELCALLEKHPSFKVEVKKIEKKKPWSEFPGNERFYCHPGEQQADAGKV